MVKVSNCLNLNTSPDTLAFKSKTVLPEASNAELMHAWAMALSGHGGQGARQLARLLKYRKMVCKASIGGSLRLPNKVSML